MNAVLIRRAVTDMRWTVLWYAIGLAVYGLFISLYFPAVRDNAGTIEEFLQSFPEALIEAFGISDMSSFSGFLGAEFLNLIWPLIVSIFVIMAGAAVVAQEIERGTAEYWLSVPESRASLLSSKLVSLLAAVIALVLVTMIVIQVGALLVDEQVSMRGLWAMGVVLLAYGVAVGGYAALFSSFASERGKPAGMAAGLTLAFYMLWVLSQLSERWDWLRYLSIFTAYQPQEALATGSIPVVGVLILLLIGLASAAGAIAVFQRRDVIV